MSSTHEELVAQAAQSGMDLATMMSTTLREDGTLDLCIYGSLVHDVWTDNGDGTGTFHVNGYDCAMNVDDGFLRIDMIAYISVFEPCEQSAEENAAAAELPSFDYQKPEQQSSDSRLVGDWRFYAMDSDDASLRVRHEDLPELLKKGMDYAGDYTLSLDSDGWYKFCDFYGFERGIWTDTGSDTGSIVVNGDKCLLSIEDGMLVLESPDCVIRYERTSDVGSAMVDDDEEISGVVLEKLAGDYFPDRYRVQGEDGEIYECEYIGFEDMEPGTAVTISKWGKDWMAEPVDDGFPFSSKDEEPKQHLYTSESGITVDDLDVRLAGGKIWSFAYTLANPTDKDAEFDPSLFVLKGADGKEIPTRAKSVSKDQVSAGTTYFRISISIGTADALKLGDVVSFYYDGVFLDKVTAKEF